MDYSHIIQYLRWSNETETWNRGCLRTTKELFKKELRRLETNPEVDPQTIKVTVL